MNSNGSSRTRRRRRRDASGRTRRRSIQDGAFPRESIAALGEQRLPRPDGPDRASAAWARACATAAAVARRGGAALRLDRDGLPDAPVRRRLLRAPRPTRPARMLREAAARRAPQHAGLQRDGARAAISGRRSARPRTATARVRLNATQVVRDLRRTRRRLRGLDARRRARRSRSRARSTSCCASDAGVSVAGAVGAASACAATPARR